MHTEHNRKEPTMRLIKAVITTVVFGIAFLSIPSASAVTPQYSSRIAIAPNGTDLWFQFTIQNIPGDIIPDTSSTYTLTYPNCSNDGYKPSCGSHTPTIRICNMDNSLSSPAVSIYCYYPAITKGYDGNIGSYDSGKLSFGNTGASYYDDNFALQPQNGPYYQTPIQVSTSNSPCDTTPNQCSYWLEYYNGVTTNSSSGYQPLMGTGIYNSLLGNITWTGGGSNNSSAPSACASLSNCLTWFVDTLSTDSSVIGQAQHIYSDFFQFKYDDLGTQVAWKDVNPQSTNCGYSTIPGNITNDRLPQGMQMPYYNANGLVSPRGACCLGPVVKLPSIAVPDNFNNSTYMSQFPRSKYITPFNACSGDSYDISHNYVLPITSALIYISFAFFLAKMLFSIFSLDSSSGVAGSAGQAVGSIKAYRKKKGN